MVVLPHSRLFLGTLLTVVISGPHVQVVDTSTGDIRYTTDEDAPKSGPIRCAAVDKTGKYLVTSGEDKILRVWEIDGLKLVNERVLPKRPTAVQFTSDGQVILVSDKFGDIFSYPFHFTPRSTAKQPQKETLSSHENLSGGQLILGHTSVLNAFLLSADEKYIVTADRDEHIRVSWFPQGYNIETYCLGHTKFVSAIHNPSHAPSELVSGGGDPVLKTWDWMTGTVKHEIEVWEAIEPFIVVRSGKRKHDEDGEVHEGRRRGKGKKARGKGKGKGKEEVENVEIEARAAERDMILDPVATEVLQAGSDENGEKVLVIHKIETFGSMHQVVFSAVGATALFTVPYPEASLVSDVHAFDFQQPVIDFFVSNDELVWVLLDGNWSQSNGSAKPSAFVRTLNLSSGKFVEVAPESRLLVSLNTKCLFQTTTDVIKTLDLYGDLTAMPKGSEAEEEHEGDGLFRGDSDKPVNKKILGRMKNKQAVQERLQQVNADGPSISTAEEDEDKEGEAKKIKAIHEDDTTISG